MSKYNVDTVEDGNRHLNDVLSVMGDIQFELNKDQTDRRLDTLLWIAIDISDGIQAKLKEEGENTVSMMRGQQS